MWKKTINNKKGILCHILPIAIIILLVYGLIFAIKLTYVGECTSNSDCGSYSYCGSDKKCHNMPNKVKRSFMSAIIIILISLVIAFIIIYWKKKEKPQIHCVSNHHLNQYSHQTHQYSPQHQEHQRQYQALHNSSDISKNPEHERHE